VRYKFKEGLNLDDNWLFENVVPNMRAAYPTDNKLCRNLGLALLYTVMDDDLSESMQVPMAISARVKAAYIASNQTIDDNPVEKIQLTIYRVEDTLMVDDMIASGEGQNMGGLPAQANTNASQNEQMQRLLI
jgi:hypothetical protein